MAEHIGIVACSAEGAALCYRTICMEAGLEMAEHDHPEITMHTHPLAEYLLGIRRGNWDLVSQLMLSSTNIVAEAGANFAICPDNTIHQAFDLMVHKSPIPWIHIADAVGAEASRKGVKQLGILGTKYLMTGPVYPEALEKFGMTCEIPAQDDRERIDEIIFKELVNGIFPEKSRLYFNTVITKLKKQGCEAVVLGCTEIPLIVDPNDCPLPTLDSTRLLARAALRKSLGKTLQ
ncbi:MAG: amino acid racemase [Deltaproteobacteria bacterium]|nr:amino acid racemase [Deltaproteobacteria bacterium]MBW2052808.1 amino acid racemase [Deltaproteobacteria bacterium]MBW2141800.1 amino acid racemase [Deltaproteobacteria bacterium]MBW2324481.1 amino acid racemase [Deltaproteobacteria bacterium]